ncbi:MAG: glycosyltransferase family protein [Nostoc sp.]
MEKNLPRLLLVSEVSLSQEGTGINRTLVNLLEDYPADRLMLYAPDQSLRNDPTAQRFQKNVIAFPEQFLPYQNNRLAPWINPLIASSNYQLFDWLSLANYDKIADFAPELILICPNGPLALVIGYKVIQSFDSPFLIYFMDDWVAFNHTRWLTGNIQSVCRSVLQQAAGWLMISPQLEKELAQQYKITPKRSLIVHNPVDLSNKIFPHSTPHSGKTFRIVYAGAIWTMHYDAIAVVAEAIYELRCDGVDVELVFYTGTTFWDLYKESWEAWEVNYGSLIPYEELNQYLQLADLLLVASSFMPEYAHITRTSVQTKLTDYMASGRAIFACGPTYSACNHFVKTWNCGLVCETNQLAQVKEILLNQIQNIDKLEILGKHGFAVVHEYFESGRVRSNLYNFIQENISYLQG